MKRCCEINLPYKSGLLSVVIFLVSFSTNCFSQLQVTPNNNPTSLATTLAGPGVTINGAVMNCPSSGGSNPSGTFIGSASNIGIASGVLLTSGDIKNAVGPNISSSITTIN